VAEKKPIDFRFDAKNPQAAKAAEKAAAALVTEVTDAVRENIRHLIAEAIEEGIPPYDAARMIVPLIGLTDAQAQAALKYRIELIDSGLPLTRVNMLVDKYADKLLRDRAEKIARTEIMDALNEGQSVAWQQAQAEGLLSAGATKEWIVTPDDRLCEQCEPMDGRTVPVGQSFPEGDPPLHPNCRCTIGIGVP